MASFEQSYCSEDGKPFIPEGIFTISDGEFYTGTDGKIILNLNDVLNLRDHPDGRRLNGCCGLDGCDGINKVCSNGHDIGTARSDCWMPHALLIEPDCVVKDEAA